MTRRTGSDRSRGTGRTRSDGAPAALGELSAEIAQLLVGLPLDYGTTVEQIAALLAGEPRNTSHVSAVIAVIVHDALADPFRETTSNRWREHLPAWLRPQMVGATVRRLLSAEVLIPTGRYVRSTDTRGGNGGKLMPVYALNLAAPALLARRDAAASGQAVSA
ncbi:hypothetical protein FKR81_32355 [Lentzea tibetensis]|uniref:Uncharacterized protein n=1 Tax=Lentzea tibetensis TaxID=2591470 RepID=A0A563EKB9_9PSEU|nr:hypothetical protein [Lentzea tibetensis]TWP47408.1 hypothetical protein FKR81_32355 [Lentzea tibetensis]